MGWRAMRVLALVGVLAGCAAVRVPEGGAAAGEGDWAGVLASRVDGLGRTDFVGIAGAPGRLEGVVRGVAARSPESEPGSFAGRAARIAYHLNAYNALAMYGVVRDGIPERLSLLDRARFFKLRRFVVGGRVISLYDYENDVIRPIGEERVHFALNCMVVSCPRLPRVPFTASGLEGELDGMARAFFAEARNVTVDDARRTVFLSAILDFYTEDFLQVAPSLIAYVNRYRGVPVPADYKVRFFSYDWTINRQP